MTEGQAVAISYVLEKAGKPAFALRSRADNWFVRTEEKDITNWEEGHAIAFDSLKEKA